LGRPKVLRLARLGEETPLEKEAREALEKLHVKAFAEYPAGRFIFDFAIPKLRMLIEVDSVTYHRRWRNVRTDEKKNQWAHKNLWHLVRIRAPDIGQQVAHAVKKRAQEFR
jgi:very-short-patch-repair endonuclease